jgi:hypothetical protein
MDVEALSDHIAAFARAHRTTFSEVSKRQSALLDLGAVVGVERHYGGAGYETQILNPLGGEQFVVKLGARGYPWNFTRILATKNRSSVEIHMNLVVEGAHDRGRYCVDVAVTSPNEVPDAQPKKAWLALENRHLRSFAEVKRLTVYPMLLAQFLGIVHEIKPRFLCSPQRNAFGWNGHMPPTLFVLGLFSGNSAEIVRGYETRGLQVHVTENFDTRIAWARISRCRSPLYWESSERDDWGEFSGIQADEVPAASEESRGFPSLYGGGEDTHP